MQPIEERKAAREERKAAREEATNNNGEFNHAAYLAARREEEGNRITAVKAVNDVAAAAIKQIALGGVGMAQPTSDAAPNSQPQTSTVTDDGAKNNEPAKPLDEMTVAELNQYFVDNGLNSPKGSKADLLGYAQQLQEHIAAGGTIVDGKPIGGTLGPAQQPQATQQGTSQGWGAQTATDPTA